MWGYHYMVNAGKCIPKSIRCPSNIRIFTDNLVKKIDMVPYGEPQVVMFGSGNKKGYTLVQLIETSNITAHFVEETDDIYLDVFSCKPFSPKDVDEMVKLHFQPKAMETKLIDRQAPTPRLDLE